MLKIFIYSFILLKLSQGLDFEDNNLCTLVDYTMHCKCENRENITLTATVHFDIKNIKIESCGTVHVPLGAVPHLQLDEIAFIDITELYIRPFSLVGIQALHTLKIHNVKKFTVAPHGFVGLMNVQNVLIKNVFSKQLLEGSFGGVTAVEKFRIEDSHFGDVQDNAFILTNITSFSILNCTFDNIDTNSFLIHTAKEVTFSTCYFQNVTFSSICLSFVDSLVFDHCFFGILEPHSLDTRNLQIFKFEDCEVEELKTNAFALLDASEQISFKNNRIYFADEHSLYIRTENFTSHDNILNCCNYFTCDCNIYWLWENNDTLFYQSFLNKSYCIGENKHLTDMVPILDSHDNCKTLELKTFVPSVSSKSADSHSIVHEVSAVKSSAFSHSFLIEYVRISFFFCITAFIFLL